MERWFRRYTTQHSPNCTDRQPITHREVGEHEVLPSNRQALKPAEEEGHIVELARFDRHVLQALLRSLVASAVVARCDLIRGPRQDQAEKRHERNPTTGNTAA